MFSYPQFVRGGQTDQMDSNKWLEDQSAKRHFYQSPAYLHGKVQAGSGDRRGLGVSGGRCVAQKLESEVVGVAAVGELGSEVRCLPV